MKFYPLFKRPLTNAENLFPLETTTAASELNFGSHCTAGYLENSLLLQ